MSNPYAPPQAAVLDVIDNRETATAADRGTRLGAAILDGIIAAAMLSVPMLIGFLVAVPMAIAGGDSTRTAAVSLSIGLGSIGFAVWCWLTYKYVRVNGQTIGKKLLGIKVVRRDGSPSTVGRIFWLRNVVNGLLGMIPMYGVIDGLFIFAESRQCLHDKLADTIVVKA
jgi:uncharacterized RDD family membrane protein YckC